MSKSTIESTIDLCVRIYFKYICDNVCKGSDGWPVQGQLSRLEKKQIVVYARFLLLSLTEVKGWNPFMENISPCPCIYQTYISNSSRRMLDSCCGYIRFGFQVFVLCYSLLYEVKYFTHSLGRFQYKPHGVQLSRWVE